MLFQIHGRITFAELDLCIFSPSQPDVLEISKMGHFYHLYYNNASESETWTRDPSALGPEQNRKKGQSQPLRPYNFGNLFYTL